MRARRAAWLAAAVLGVAACSANAPLLRSSLPPQSTRSFELGDVPFFPQERFQCGPAALATVLSASGVAVTPAELTPLVYLPARHGSLQDELIATARDHARLPYTLTPELGAVIAELQAHRPVLVLHNYGLRSWPRWHYAVVIGYDAARDALVLHSGTTERKVMPARHFMLAWDHADRWAMVVLAPGDLPVNPDRAKYLETAASFERRVPAADARRAFDAAVQRWPDDPVAWIGRGTAAYRGRDFEAAAADYSTALRLDDSNAGTRNNLAMALLELGCPRQAFAQVADVDLSRLPESVRGSVSDTRRAAEVAMRSDSGRQSGRCTNGSL